MSKFLEKWVKDNFHREEHKDFFAKVTEYIDELDIYNTDEMADYNSRYTYLMIHDRYIGKIFNNYYNLKAEYIRRMQTFRIYEAEQVNVLSENFPRDFHMDTNFIQHIGNYFNSFKYDSEWWVADCTRRIKEMKRRVDDENRTESEREMFKMRLLSFGHYIKQNFMIYYCIQNYLINNQMYLPLNHLDPLFSQLVKVLSGQEKKKISILNIFSGAGKTDATNTMICYEFARNKDAIILHISASDAVLKKNAESIRNVCMNDYYGLLFGHRLRKEDRSRVTQWAFNSGTKGYNYMARTYGSAFLGVSAGGTEASKIDPNLKKFTEGELSLYDAYEARESFEISEKELNDFMEYQSSGVLLLDDPQEEGKAPSEYKKDWEDFMGKVSSRARGDTKIILNQQRVNINDLSGYIIRELKGEYVLVKVPALNPKTKQMMQDTRTHSPINRYSFILKVMISTPSIFASMYQNDPLVDEGDIFKADSFHRFDINDIKADNFKKFFITADTAMVDSAKADYSVICLWGLSKHDRLYMIDMVRGKWEGLDLVEKCGSAWGKWVNTWGDGMKYRVPFFMEAISGGLNTKKICNQLGIPVQSIKRKTNKDNKMPDGSFVAMPTAGNVKGKVARAQLIRDSLEMNHVWINTEFHDVFVKECLEFSRDGKHEHDDMVDCLTDAVKIGYDNLGAGSMTLDAMRKLRYTMGLGNNEY